MTDAMADPWNARASSKCLTSLPQAGLLSQERQEALEDARLCRGEPDGTHSMWLSSIYSSLNFHMQ